MRELTTNVWSAGFQQLSFACMLKSSGILRLQFRLKTWFLTSLQNSSHSCLSSGLNQELQIRGEESSSQNCRALESSDWMFTSNEYLGCVEELVSTLPHFPICKTEGVRLSNLKQALWNCTETNIDGKIFKAVLKAKFEECIANLSCPKTCFARRPCLRTELEAKCLSYNLLTLSKSLSCCVSPFPNNIAIRLIFTYLRVT